MLWASVVIEASEAASRPLDPEDVGRLAGLLIGYGVVPATRLRWLSVVAGS